MHTNDFDYCYTWWFSVSMILTLLYHGSKTIKKVKCDSLVSDSCGYNGSFYHYLALGN